MMLAMVRRWLKQKLLFSPFCLLQAVTSVLSPISSPSYHALINILRVAFMIVCFKGVLYPLNLYDLNPTVQSSN